MEFCLQVTVPEDKLDGFDMLCSTLETVTTACAEGSFVFTVEGSPADLQYLAKKLEAM